MENNSKSTSKFVSEFLFGLLFIGVLITFVMPFMELKNENGDLLFSVPAALALTGGSFSVNDISYSLKNTSIVYIITLVLFIFGTILFYINDFLVKDNKKLKVALYSIISVILIYTGLAFSTSGFYAQIIDGIQDGEGSIYANTANLYGGFVITFILAMLFLTLNEIFHEKKYTVNEIAETAILVALAVVLDTFAKVQMQANGGSISFSAVPLFLIAIRYGFFKGFIASSFYFGVLTCLIDGYGFQTFPFDYFIALSGYGFIGLFFNFAKRFYINEENKTEFKKKQYLYSLGAIILSGVPIMIIRYIGHMISGAVLYSTPFVANFIYQSTYVPAAVWISIGITAVLLPAIILINRVYPVKEQVENE